MKLNPPKIKDILTNKDPAIYCNDQNIQQNTKSKQRTPD